MRKKTLSLLFLAMTALVQTGCDSDTQLPPFTTLLFLENFQEAEDGTLLDIGGWGNFSDAGIPWQEEAFDGNGYASISNTTEVPVSAWLISPAITLGGEKILEFQSAQHHLAQEGCSLEVLLSQDYAGDPATATWTPLQAIVADSGNQWYGFLSSGSIDLTAWSGDVHIAFRAVIGTQGGTYFIDNVKMH